MNYFVFSGFVISDLIGRNSGRTDAFIIENDEGIKLIIDKGDYFIELYEAMENKTRVCIKGVFTKDGGMKAASVEAY